jgi:ADP-heptose:LPS heptosyltransferase
MKTKKRVGIWMDHSNARVMEYSIDDYQVTVVESKFSKPVNQTGMLHSENLLHNKEKQSDKAYFKELIEIIKDYDEIILFGPTDAKTELFNLIKSDHRYDKLKIETKSANKMSDNQMHAFIKDYFSKLLNYVSPFTK